MRRFLVLSLTCALAACGDDGSCRSAGAVRINGVCACPEGSALEKSTNECKRDEQDAKPRDDGGELGLRVDAASPRDAGTTSGDATTNDSDAPSSQEEAGDVEPSADAASDGGPPEDASVDSSQMSNEPPDAGFVPAVDAGSSPPACVASTETCDGTDNDCDGQIDEGVKNACGTCGSVPAETCDGTDNDCDGQTDEGVANACGNCGAVPAEVCDGVDNDCDKTVDNADKVSCPAGQACTAGRCQPLCGNGKKDTGEVCDPTAPGYTVFSCSQSCKAQKIFENCTPDATDPFAHPEGDCGPGFQCGSFGSEEHEALLKYCIPSVPCPEVKGIEWEVFGDVCVQPCTTSSQCPIPVQYCFQNPLGNSPIAWCAK